LKKKRLEQLNLQSWIAFSDRALQNKAVGNISLVATEPLVTESG